ncbi:MAG: hypothetical protein ACTHJM_05500 [Marmoricola sp.]
MAEFLKAFIPTFAFMLVPVMIPILAVVIGSIRDAFSGENRAESVEDRVRARLAQAA